MSLATYQDELLPAIEAALQAAVQPAQLTNTQSPQELLAMLRYHMGWEGEGAGPKASGKRVRPTLVLLSAAAAGADWRTALPAAAAVEILHNFSLIHDDIQDNSDQRRGRPTVWAKWGMPQAINAGDTLFALAHMALEGLSETASDAAYIQAARLLPSGAVEGRLPVLMDSGVRRGTDILKALALGAKAVLIGRPYLYGLGCGGAAGVERVITILRKEFEMAMILAGRKTVRDIDASLLRAD